MKRLSCTIFIGVFPSDLCFTGMGKIGTSNPAKIECAHRRAHKLLTDFNHKILIFYSIYDYFALLIAFGTNTLILHRYFKNKLFCHQPFHMRNTRHRIIIILMLHFLIIQKQLLKNVIYTK